MEHFIKRLYACIIDFVVVFLLISLVNNILFVPLSLLKIPFISAYYPYAVTIVVTLAYFTIMEAKTNKTIGKMLTKLYVSDEEGYMSYFSAFVRNITKCFWVPLIFDVIIGKILGFPSRLFDKIAGTDVYADYELEVYDENKAIEDKSKKIESKITSDIDNKIEKRFNQKPEESKTPAGNSKAVIADESAVTAKKVESDAAVVSQESVSKALKSDAAEVSKKDVAKEVKSDTSKATKSESIDLFKDAEDDKKTSEETKDTKTADDKKSDDSEFIFADDSDITATHNKQVMAKNNIKKTEDKKTTENKDKNQKQEKKTQEEQTPYEDEILDLIIEEDESDSFVELTKDDF